MQPPDLLQFNCGPESCSSTEMANVETAHLSLHVADPNRIGPNFSIERCWDPEGTGRNFIISKRGQQVTNPGECGWEMATIGGKEIVAGVHYWEVEVTSDRCYIGVVRSNLLEVPWNRETQV